MDLYEKFQRLVNKLNEASGDDDELPIGPNDSGEGQRPGRWNTSDYEQPPLPPKKNPAAGKVKPARGFEAVPTVGLPRTGTGDRTAAAAGAFNKINKALEIISNFINEYGDLSVQRKQDASVNPRADKPKRERGEEPPPKQSKLDKYNVLSREKAMEQLNTFLDPQKDPKDRTSALKMLMDFMVGIPRARKVWIKDAIEQRVDDLVQKQMALTDKYFAGGNKKIKVKGKEFTQAQLASQARKFFHDQIKPQFEKTYGQEDKEFEDAYFLARNAWGLVPKELQKFRDEKKNYRYVPGAFGEPPKLIEIGSDMDRRVAAGGGRNIYPGQDDDDGGGGGSKPTVKRGGKKVSGPDKPKEPKIKKSDAVEVDPTEDAFLDSLIDWHEKSFDRFINEAIRISAADYTPTWWDEL